MTFYFCICKIRLLLKMAKQYTVVGLLDHATPRRPPYWEVMLKEWLSQDVDSREVLIQRIKESGQSKRRRCGTIDSLRSIFDKSPEICSGQPEKLFEHSRTLWHYLAWVYDHSVPLKGFHSSPVLISVVEKWGVLSYPLALIHFETDREWVYCGHEVKEVPRVWGAYGQKPVDKSDCQEYKDRFTLSEASWGEPIDEISERLYQKYKEFGGQDTLEEFKSHLKSGDPHQ